MFQTYSTSDYYDSNSLCFRSILLQITVTQVILPILTYSASDLYCLENYFEAPFTTVRH